ncbi:hypothetical protein M1L60_31315 [Actinoplanes sp. TRM 88003]|uniref:Fumarylacetoacetase-like C-terminal domain-containing protein n=1 Tax=Paractinoplanes aksuensis TaxID=2939490 RepID=A0ABT1DW79_9ACTN|nr:hypothetical protein [Actinoplanes aksuensis]MCO8275078.1 hypothetical protein [Actinoplanes aksuensis]
MKYLRVGPVGWERPVAASGGRFHDLPAVTADIDGAFLATPQGVALSGRFPYLAEGDVVEVEVEGLGRQRNTVRNAA